MIEQTESGIFSPIQLSSVQEPVFSIGVSLPPEVQEELQRYAAEDGNSWTREAENALMFYRESSMTPEDHAKENIEWAVRNFGPPKPVPKQSMKQWKDFVRRVNEEVSCLRTAGTLGNLILPEELYEFVKLKIETGEFASPTEVVTAAIPFLRAERGKPPRAEFADPRLSRRANSGRISR